MKKKIIFALLNASIFLLSLGTGTVQAASTNTAVIYHLHERSDFTDSGEVLTDTTHLQYDTTTNLLQDKNGNRLMEMTNNGILYTLDAVQVTRYRQKISFEYYYFENGAYKYVGVDSGYADVDDYLSDYLLTVNQFNTKFEQNISSTDYAMTFLDQNVPSFIPAYNASEPNLVFRVLVGKKTTHSLVITLYQNQQNQMTPNPIGKTKATLDAQTEFWRVRQMSRSVTVILGQTINIKSLSTVSTQFTKGTRTGRLRLLGYFNFASDNTFIVSDTITINGSTPSTIHIGAIYEVEDYNFVDTPVSPGYDTALIGSAGIDFFGGDAWKSASVSETLSVADADELNKLSAYPFNLDADPFDNPEYEVWVEDNWALMHRIVLNYYYAASGPVPSEIPETGANINNLGIKLLAILLPLGWFIVLARKKNTAKSSQR